MNENFQDIHSRSKIQKLIKDSKVKVNGIIVIKSSFVVKPSDNIEILIEEEKPAELMPVDMGIPIIFQDDNFAIIHKPVNMTVHPGINTKDDTLVHALMAQFKSLSDGSEFDRPGIIHRLDRDTEGLMIIAKTNRCHFLLSRMFQDRQIKKNYTAFIWGNMPENEYLISGYISRHPTQRKKMHFHDKKQNDNDKTAILRYSTLRKTGNFSKLEIHLITGRTHQIRATFASSGNYIVADTLYSKNSKIIKKYKISQDDEEFILKTGMLLAATELEFIHPITKKNMIFNIQQPDRFSEFENRFF